MKRTIKRLSAIIVAAAIFTVPEANASDGVEVNHLGVSNTIVRVTGNSKFVMLPVQESSDDAKINVVVDGNIIAETIYVRLAKTKIDYCVPFDLTRYKNHNVVLDIVMPQDRGSVREAKDDACWKAIVLADSFATANTEKYRPAFHHTPLYGWMNDPNGMFYKDGKWHLYYQYNPYGSKWQNMTWGHSVSTDLINWEHLPNAISANGLGAIFSGSCVVDKTDAAGFGKDAVVAFFTSAGTSQMQSLASSTDGGLSFDIYPGNPIITLESEARDPKVFWNEAAGKWNLVLAHALDHEMLIFASSDMKHWELQSAFGKGLGAQGGVWECPDMFELPVEDTDQKKWVLLCNINPDGPFGGSGTQYFVGDFDGKTFRPDTDKNGRVRTKWLDYGKDHYATVTWSGAPGNRRTAIGWMSNWQYAADVPTMQFRSANTLPREIGLFRDSDGELYASCAPSPELLKLRGALTRKAGRTSLGKKQKVFALPAANGGICEIVLDIDAQSAESVDMTLSNKEGETVVMKFDPAEATLSFDRTRSGITDFSDSFPAVTVAPTHDNSGKLQLRLFIDRSSIEVFGNNGRCVMTNLVFPNHPYTALSVSSKGGSAKLANLKIYSIKDIH